MSKSWIYLNNTFETNTRRSNVKMLKLANDHHSRLAAEAATDPAIQAMYDRFTPTLVDFRNLMSKRITSGGSGKGKTNTMKELFAKLSSDWIKNWETDVLYHYREGSEAAISIFPRNRAPFQGGPYEERILAMSALKDALAPYAPLASVRTDVTEKYDQLVAARDSQKQQMELSGKVKNELEKKRVELSRLMFGDLGQLIDLFRSNPTDVERFFDMALLRKPAPDHDTVFQTAGTVDAHTTAAIELPEKLELSIQAQCIFTNTSNEMELEFFFSANPSASDNAVKIKVLSAEIVETSAAAAGWSPGARYLIVKNAGELTAAFEITVMAALG